MDIQNSGYNKLNKLEKFGLNLIIFAKLLGTTTIGLGWILLLVLKKIKLKKREFVYIVAVIFQLVVSLILSLNTASFHNTLFYFSFLPVYLLFKKKDNKTMIAFLQYLMFAMFVFTLIEFVFLNTPLNKYVWYFGPDHVHRALILNLQKALGLGTLSSSSGAVAVLCLALYSKESQKNQILYNTITLSTILLLMSGAGFFLYILYITLLFLNKSKKILHTIVEMSFLLFIFATSISFFSKIGINKFTIEYVIAVYENKDQQIEDEHIEKDYTLLFWGEQASSEKSEIKTSTDFAINGLFKAMGIFSTFLIILAPILIIGYKKKYTLLLILYLASWVHYPAISSPIGCIYMGLFLSFYGYNQTNDPYSFSSSSVNLKECATLKKSLSLQS